MIKEYAKFLYQKLKISIWKAQEVSKWNNASYHMKKRKPLKQKPNNYN